MLIKNGLDKILVLEKEAFEKKINLEKNWISKNPANQKYIRFNYF